MKDMLARLEQLRKDAAECALIRDLATSQNKRELFDRLARDMRTLADQVERAIAAEASSITFLGRKTQEPFPKQDDE